MITPSFALTATERVLPRLALDFTTASLDPRVTFTRALNTATRINSSGLVETVNADTPRFDYTLNTGGACKGLLIEESRTNLLTYSALVGGTDWVTAKSGVATLATITTNYATSPDGTTSASRLQMTLNGGTTTSDWTQVFHSSFAQTNGAAYAQSIYLKSNDGNTYTVLLRDDTGSNAAQTLLTITPQWQRFTQNVTASNTTATGVKLWLRGGVGTSATADILAWGAQYEAGAFPTSYIPTVASTVLRNADVASMTGTNFSDWFNATEGSFVAQSDTVDTTGFPTTLYSAVVNNSITLDTSVASIRAVMFANNVAVLVKTSTKLSVNTFAIAYKLNSHNAGFNGAAVTAATSGAVPTGLTSLNIGSTGSSSYANGHIYKIMYYPQRLTDNELRAFTKG